VAPFWKTRIAAALRAAPHGIQSVAMQVRRSQLIESPYAGPWPATSPAHMTVGGPGMHSVTVVLPCMRQENRVGAAFLPWRARSPGRSRGVRA